MLRVTAIKSILVFAILGAAAAQEDTPDDPSQMIFKYSEDVTPASYRAAQSGLEFLAARQNPNGSWNGDVGFKLNQNYEVIEIQRPHVGVTALAGMAFLSGGHLPDRGKYSDTVGRCIQYVIECVRERGYITSHGSRMYSHAFATLFLAEVYGMTNDPRVGAKLQEAVNLIVECQNRVGSWRYEPFAPESDMSITVCQLMALRGARNIGMKVPSSTIDRAVEYVRRSYVGPGHNYMNRFSRLDPYYNIQEGAFLYQVFPDDVSGYYRSSFSLTAAGVVSLFNAGRYSGADLDKSLEYLMEMFDTVSGNRWRHHYFYWYGHYYAVQAMYIAGGRYWEDYYPKIRAQLIDNQRSKGYWDNPVGPGENFATAVAVIILQIPFNYLPIFQR